MILHRHLLDMYAEGTLPRLGPLQTAADRAILKDAVPTIEKALDITERRARK